MSDLEEPRIRCPSCGKLVPPMRYCIFCGSRLPQVAPPTVGPPQPAPPPSLPPIVQPPTPTRVTPAPVSVEAKDEISNLMSGITVLHERKASLLNLFQSMQISERVFLKLFSEYSGKLNESLKARFTKLEELRRKLDEGNKRLDENTMKLEELEVRRKVGEIDAKTYGEKAEGLKAEERELVNSVKTLKMNIERLEKILADKKPSGIRDLETSMRSYQGVLEKLVGEGKISTEILDTVGLDIEKTAEFLDSLIRDRKEREKNLREQLETLQTRHRLSELSIEEYEKKKRELQVEIDKIWA